jgi:hypothetical protein
MPGIEPVHSGDVEAAALELTDGAAAGDWIEPRLGGEFGAVTLQVPHGFEAYARVFHPFFKGIDRRKTRWAEVAAACGTTPHREMQWGSIAKGFSRETNQPPFEGEMDHDDLDALCEILAAYSADPAHCFFGLCIIECWEDSFDEDELRLHPMLRHPMGRDHIVLEGPLAAVDQIVEEPKPGTSHRAFVAHIPPGEEPPTEEEIAEAWKSRGTPNLIWPADHSWLVASEVDFDSTLVGGRRDLIDAIVASADLEAWEVEPDTSLAIDADKINARSV